MKIIFEGVPPYELPVVQTAKAQAADEIVEMTLYVLAEGQELVPIRVPMTLAAARTLASKLATAAMQAELKARS